MNPTGAATIRGSVSLYDHNGELITDKNGETSRKYNEVKTTDAFQHLLGDGKARVVVGLDEKMGGPYGYSSAGVSVSVTLTCDQTEKAIQEASELAFKECVSFIDNTLPSAHRMLISHLEQHYVRE